MVGATYLLSPSLAASCVKWRLYRWALSLMLLPRNRWHSGKLGGRWWRLGCKGLGKKATWFGLCGKVVMTYVVSETRPILPGRDWTQSASNNLRCLMSFPKPGCCCWPCGGIPGYDFLFVKKLTISDDCTGGHLLFPSVQTNLGFPAEVGSGPYILRRS